MTTSNLQQVEMEAIIKFANQYPQLRAGKCFFTFSAGETDQISRLLTGIFLSSSLLKRIDEISVLPKSAKRIIFEDVSFVIFKYSSDDMSIMQWAKRERFFRINNPDESCGDYPAGGTMMTAPVLVGIYQQVS